jgi:serine protease Do
MRLRFMFLAAWMAAATSAYGWSPGAGADTQVFVGGSRAGSYLGIRIGEITAERAKALSLKEEHGVEVTDVETDSPAATAGLKTGDVILQYNGQRVEGVEQFLRYVRETPAGRDVRLAVSRNGSPQTLTVKTGTRKSFSFRSGEPFRVEVPNFELPEFHMPNLPPDVLSFTGPRLGIDAHTVSGQLADYFGVKQGVLVSSVHKGSAAERAGIRAGDVILRVDDRSIANERDIRSALRSASSSAKRTVSVVVSRDKREMTLNVTIDEPSRRDQVRLRPLLRGGSSIRI